MKIKRIKRRALFAMLSVSFFAATGCDPFTLQLFTNFVPTEFQ
ncbi:MAG: hypothetical protein O7D94_07920 [Planctomycetota bacterium]|nr:hypothetical protein [Planctomycetota bacterium]